MTELSGLLRTVSSPDLDGIEDAADFVSICPDLVWTLRDFYLDLEAHGQLITADEYLENSLRPKQGNSDFSFGKKEKRFSLFFLESIINGIFKKISFLRGGCSSSGRAYG